MCHWCQALDRFLQREKHPGFLKPLLPFLHSFHTATKPRLAIWYENRLEMMYGLRKVLAPLKVLPAGRALIEELEEEVEFLKKGLSEHGVDLGELEEKIKSKGKQIKKSSGGVAGADNTGETDSLLGDVESAIVNGKDSDVGIENVMAGARGSSLAKSIANGDEEREWMKNRTKGEEEQRRRDSSADNDFVYDRPKSKKVGKEKVPGTAKSDDGRAKPKPLREPKFSVRKGLIVYVAELVEFEIEKRIREGRWDEDTSGKGESHDTTSGSGKPSFGKLTKGKRKPGLLDLGFGKSLTGKLGERDPPSGQSREPSTRGESPGHRGHSRTGESERHNVRSRHGESSRHGTLSRHGTSSGHGSQSMRTVSSRHGESSRHGSQSTRGVSSRGSTSSRHGTQSTRGASSRHGESTRSAVPSREDEPSGPRVPSTHGQASTQGEPSRHASSRHNERSRHGQSSTHNGRSTHRQTSRHTVPANHGTPSRRSGPSIEDRSSRHSYRQRHPEPSVHGNDTVLPTDSISQVPSTASQDVPSPTEPAPEPNEPLIATDSSSASSDSSSSENEEDAEASAQPNSRQTPVPPTQSNHRPAEAGSRSARSSVSRLSTYEGTATNASAATATSRSSTQAPSPLIPSIPPPSYVSNRPPASSRTRNSGRSPTSRSSGPPPTNRAPVPSGAPPTYVSDHYRTRYEQEYGRNGESTGNEGSGRADRGRARLSTVSEQSGTGSSMRGPPTEDTR